MYLKSDPELLLEAVTKAGGEVEPHRLPPALLAVLVLAPQLARITCETCCLELVAHRTRRFCSSCARGRQRFEPARRSKQNGRRG